ncbi:MAG: hypothetical protein AB7Q45_21985, partial [Planctomycetaceae bacterium]
MGAANRQPALSYLCSAILHAGLIAVVVWGAAPIRVPTAALTPGLQTAISDLSEAVPAGGVPWDAAEAQSSPTGPAAESAHRVSVDAPPSTETPGLARFARERLEQDRLAAEGKSTEEQLAELELLAQRLDRVASEESVREVSGTLSDWLGATERAVVPAENADGDKGEFDVGTAQISDVRKIETESGVQYNAVLVDALGNTKETLLDEIDGP